MALTERYVSAAGGGLHDGTTEANAFTWTEMVTDLNTPRVGHRYNVKGAITVPSSNVITGDGTATSPNIIRGYSSTIGDGYLGRSSGGALDTTNLPVIDYGTVCKFDGSGATFLIIQDLNFTSSISGYIIVVGAGSKIVNCKVSNTGIDITSGAINISTGGSSHVVNCDASTGASGGVAAIAAMGIGQLVTGCRVTSPGATGIRTRSSAALVENTIYGCVTGIFSDTATATATILRNTIYGCSGDGINILTATTGAQTIVGNTITDNGGYGINFNVSTCVKFYPFNRLRDNTSGAINGGDDWTDATNIVNVTTDTGGPETDYTNAAGLDFSLIAAAPGISKGPGYLTDIGAVGTPVVAGGGLMTNPGMSGGMRG